MCQLVSVALCVILSSFAVVADDPLLLKEYSEGNRLFASAIYKELVRGQEGNLLICPLSVQTVMALASTGAKGETAQQITKGLILPEDPQKLQHIFRTLSPALKGNEYYSLSTANKIYVSNTFKISKTYQELARDIFDAEVDGLDFSRHIKAAQQVNQWVEQKTNNKIRQLIDPADVNSFTKILLLNAMHFKGKWKFPFDVQDTIQKPFFESAQSSKMVNMMHGTDLYNYYENKELDCKFLELPYVGMDLSMVIVLPNKVEGLGLLEENVQEIFKEQPFTKQFVKVQIPRFSMESTVHFKPVLQKLGIEKVFGETADLSGISADGLGNLYVDKVIQKTFINVTETGTEAAAATSVSLLERIGEGEEVFTAVPFVADHPFLFFIVDNHRGSILFAGTFKSTVHSES